MNKRSRIYKIKNFKIENFEIAKSFLGSLPVQRYIVFMSLHDSSASYWTSKKGLPHDLSKMPEAITRWPLLVELQYWLSRLQRVRLPYRPSFRFFLKYEGVKRWSICPGLPQIRHTTVSTWNMYIKHSFASDISHHVHYHFSFSRMMNRCVRFDSTPT